MRGFDAREHVAQFQGSLRSPTTAFNDALEKAQALAQEKMGAITGGLNIPGIF